MLIDINFCSFLCGSIKFVDETVVRIASLSFCLFHSRVCVYVRARSRVWVCKTKMVVIAADGEAYGINKRPRGRSGGSLAQAGSAHQPEAGRRGRDAAAARVDKG